MTEEDEIWKKLREIDRVIDHAEPEGEAGITTSGSMSAVQYRRGRRFISIRVKAPENRNCTACGKPLPGREFNRHHWREKFTFKEVKANHDLALEDSIPTCVPHHRIANDLREIVEYLQAGHVTPGQIINLVESMPADMKEAWMDLMKHFIAQPSLRTIFSSKSVFCQKLGRETEESMCWGGSEVCYLQPGCPFGESVEVRFGNLSPWLFQQERWKGNE